MGQTMLPARSLGAPVSRSCARVFRRHARRRPDRGPNPSVHGGPQGRGLEQSTDQHGSWQSQPGHWAQVVASMADSAETPREQGCGSRIIPDEESRLRAAVSECESDSVRTAVYIALNTGMRSDEIKRLQWRNIGFATGELVVGVSKTEGGRGRRIPLNAGLRAVIEAHRDWYVRRFDSADADLYLFPAGQRGRGGA